MLLLFFCCLCSGTSFVFHSDVLYRLIDVFVFHPPDDD